MLHAPPTTLRTQRRFIARQRFNLLGALVATAVLPFLLRAFILPQDTFYAASINALIFNVLAVLIAFWTRLSIETYPGNRSTHVILPSIVLAHATIVTILLLTRLPYDRLALVAGFVAHILWGYGLYFTVQRFIRHRIAIVPFGEAGRLKSIENVDVARDELCRRSTMRPAATGWSPILPPTFRPNGRRCWPMPRWRGGWSIRSSNCSNR